MSQTIFITGGSGYIGSVIIEQAIAQGYTVKSLSRSEASDEKLRKLGATPVRGDLTTLDVLTKEASEADIVISMADSIAGANYQISPEERTRINHAGFDALAKGLEGTGKPLIQTSGTFVLAADPNGNEVDESSPGWEVNPFGMNGEGHCMSWNDKGVKVMSVRLAPYVYGRGGSGVKLFMAGAAQAGELVYVDEGKARVTTVHVDDAARLYLLVAQKGKAGEAYNAAYETHVTNRERTEAMGKTLGVPVRAQSYEETEKKMGRFFAQFLSLENRASGAKAKRELGWEIKADKGILDEIATGSYVQLAEELKKGMA
ncbi:putative NAD dependent epimerase/dehydratase [Lophiotrema nucula]|uniref:Putative NAD dependent epimerase/dehydratase n=1 Tax=Lophiotrema nucula TaxID=690887 RepID=A0A6A5ZIK5_9PLEO|nr:putative NAD dependent epimerase/dehydratase [Lophiotrema nucula]